MSWSILATDRDAGPSASSDIGLRVEEAREVQRERFRGTKVHSNAQMTPRFIKKFCEPDAAGSRLLELVTDRLGLSARSYSRILKVDRTIADLEGSEGIRENHISEAIQYRSLDRKTV
ncbi:hypothetical protein [Geobacter sp.]|uniref:magnesium chelatase subunit ChlI family protein n=1 Tax=Geobacter sp. TaxID=46610 RepID=UPI002604B7F0|nr:hypothetical protein [Geobacter sp.]